MSRVVNTTISTKAVFLFLSENLSDIAERALPVQLVVNRCFEKEVSVSTASINLKTTCSRGIRKRKSIVLLLLMTIAIGVTVKGDDCPPKPRGWFVRICRAQTRASGVRLEIGFGGLESSHRYWRDWTHANTETELPLPIDLIYAKEIWIKGTSHDGEDVSMCTAFNDHNTQKMTFNEDEEHETSRDDHDDCEC